MPTLAGQQINSWSIIDYRQKVCSCSMILLRALARICHATSIHLSVCLSVTRVYCIKTAERIVKILSLSDRPIISVLRPKGHCINLTASPLKGGSNFRLICGYITERVLDRGIVTTSSFFKFLIPPILHPYIHLQLVLVYQLYCMLCSLCLYILY